MKRVKINLGLVLICLFFLIGPHSRVEALPGEFNEDPASLLKQADDSYAAQEYLKAYEIYQKLYRMKYASPEALVMGGNAAYNMGETGNAVLFYLRALKVDPSIHEARSNLEKIQPETNIVANNSFSNVIEKWYRELPEMVVVIFAEIVFILFLVSIWNMCLSKTETEKRREWIARSLFLAIAVTLFIFFLKMHEEIRSIRHDAVVIHDKVVTRSGPGLEYYEELQLPAGTIVDLKSEPINGWVEIKLLDGTLGYIESQALEKI